MSGLGGLNKSPRGVVLGVVQLQLPIVKTPRDLAAQTASTGDKSWLATRRGTGAGLARPEACRAPSPTS